MNDGFSGEGNAVFSYDGIDEGTDMKQWIAVHLENNLKIVAPDLTYKMFMFKFQHMGGIVEAFVEGEIKTSPSAHQPAGRL
ncbi:MAG: hypothetical protein FJY20_10810 [Bacteroidetes bacterium]|nr:hypothetical protein [Bacteroidota bacterium]